VPHSKQWGVTRFKQDSSHVQSYLERDQNGIDGTVSLETDKGSGSTKKASSDSD
jgi:2-succinyl-5-enolpyruvyl-6-hydroxy-3-cyclohexene-1-carboxylate synthase